MPRHHLLRRNAPSPEPRTSRPRLGNATGQPQFQTPPSREIPQLHSSSGPGQPAHPAAAAQAAIFSLFGRGVPGRQRVQMMDEDDEEEEEEEEEEEGEEEQSRFGLGERHIDLDTEGNEIELSEDEEGESRSGLGRRHVDLDPERNEDELSEEDMEEMVGEELEDVEDEDELMRDRERSPSPLPSNLREISSLASWTVSTHKPGCGVSALRHPSPTQYWQSDGPQPHMLTLHFFKLVAIVKIRVYLDFEMDESYTPTKMAFLAGMGGNDLVEFATWEGEGPCGWVDVPLEGVGGRDGGWVRKKRRKRTHGKGKSSWPEYMFSDSENAVEFDEAAYEDDDDQTADEEDEDDPYAGNVLKAMVIQMRVIENHQNGKDTHVRGFQVFARDDDRRRMGNAPSASADGRIRRQSVRKSLRGSVNDDGPDGRDGHGDAEKGKVNGLDEPDWMGEPVIR